MVISNVYWQHEIGKGSKPYSYLEYDGSVSPFQPRWMGFPLGTFLTQVGVCGG